jgi:hypothetical protein
MGDRLSSLEMARYAAGFAAAALAFGSVNVSEAVAGSPSGGVHVDPNSPAGKQYVIPIVGARSETSGGNKSSGANPPAFGVGITPDKTSTSTTPTTASARSAPARKKASKSQNHRRQRFTVSGAAPAGGTPPSAPSSPSSGSSSGSGSSDWLPLGAGGALVLLVGGGGGLALRRRI